MKGIRAQFCDVKCSAVLQEKQKKYQVLSFILDYIKNLTTSPMKSTVFQNILVACLPEVKVVGAQVKKYVTGY